MTIPGFRTASRGDTRTTVNGAGLDGAVQPDSPADLAALLQQASVDGTPVYPVGAGMHQRVGLEPEPGGIAVSTRGLAGVLRYDPDDLVLSVGAGTTLAEVQAVLAGHRQRLPVEAPGGDGATIGGVLALALNGPRQLNSPSLRDLLLGMSVAQTDGTVAKSGGMVVKNVTGFDMGRLHVGARGTLGVVTSANFKVLPLVETDATVVAAFPAGAGGLAAALDASSAIRVSALRPVACDIVADRDGTTVAVRFEGREPGVRRQVEDVRQMLPADVTLLDAEGASASWWAGHVAGLGIDDESVTAIRLDGRPRDVGQVVGSISEAIAGAERPGWRFSVSPGLGQVWLHLSDVDDAYALSILNGTRALPYCVGLLAGSPAVRATWSVASVEDVRAIDHTLRDQFDPVGILNHGRFPLAPR